MTRSLLGETAFLVLGWITLHPFARSNLDMKRSRPFYWGSIFGAPFEEAP